MRKKNERGVIFAGAREEVGMIVFCIFRVSIFLCGDGDAEREKEGTSLSFFLFIFCQDFFFSIKSDTVVAIINKYLMPTLVNVKMHTGRHGKVKL